MEIIKEFKNNKNIVIKPADKNLGLTIMNTKDYICMCEKHLNDTTTYKEIETVFNPRDIYHGLIDTLTKHNRMTYKGKATKLCKALLQLQDSPTLKSASFYCLPKMHKQSTTIPGRPIASAINTATYHTSVYISNLLQPIVKELETITESSDDFVKNMFKNVNKNNVILCADISSLYPNIPIIEGINRVRNLLIQRKSYPMDMINFITDLLNWVLHNNYVYFNGKTYLQISGTAMGTPLAPTYANLFVYTIEQPILQKINDRTDSLITFYTRFIDDIAACMRMQDALEFLEHFNNTIDSIKLEQITTSKTGIFLDLTLTIEEDGKLTYELYQKPICKYQYITPFSSHPTHVIKNFISNEARRIQKRCSNIEAVAKHTQAFIERLAARGHRMDEIKTLTSNPNPNNDPIPNHNVTLANTEPYGNPNNTIPKRKRTLQQLRMFIKLPKFKTKINWKDILKLPAWFLNSHVFLLRDYEEEIQLVMLNNPNMASLITTSRLQNTYDTIVDNQTKKRKNQSFYADSDD